MAKAPGKAHREGITVMEMAELFPTDEAAREWFEAKMWPEGRHCPRCGSIETIECKGKPPMPYWCPACKSHFSVRIGTVLEGSPLPLRKWVYAIYLHLTSLKGVSSMKLHRDLGVTQKTAWFMLQRIREAFDEGDKLLRGTVEVDETYIGGKRRNMHNKKRKELKGRGLVGKEAVVGMKCCDSKNVRAKTAEDTTAFTLHKLIAENMDQGPRW